MQGSRASDTAPSRRYGIRAAVVGAGLMGGYHAAAIRRAGGTVVAAVDPNRERARKLAPDGLAVASLDELWHTQVDIVHVCAPLERHVELTGTAIDHGLNVLVEKPLAEDGSATIALLDAARRQGVMVVPVHQFLFQRGVQRLLAGSAELGPLVRCVFEAATAGTEYTSLSPDELVADILPHPLALFARLPTVDLRNVDWLVASPAAGELRAVGGCREATLEISISTRARPIRATLDVVGTNGSGHADLFHGFAVVERGSGTGARKLVRPFGLAALTMAHAGANIARRAWTRETAYPGLRELVRETHAAIAAGSPAPIADNETAGVALARDAIIEAARAGSPAGEPVRVRA